MSVTKELLRQRLTETYDPKILFKLAQVYKLMLEDTDTDVYDTFKEPESTIRRDLQELRDDSILTFVDNDGTYFINPLRNVDFKENIFSLELLQQHGRIYLWDDKLKQTSAPGIKFVKWMIADKNEVMSHEVARELGIPCQTRAGKALFQKTQDEIRDDIIDNGYDYHCYQPAIEELPKPISYKGKVYKFITRDGCNRYELPWDRFPCALIECEDEYSALQYGCIANNPNKEKKNDCTPDDVKRMIRLGFQYGKIEKTQEAVYDVLAERYKETRKKDRRNFVAEILSEEGIKVSIEPYDIKKAEKHLLDNYNVKLNPKTDYIVGWGRESDHYRKFFNIYDKAVKNPGVQYKEYAFLEMGNGVSIQPTEDNACDRRVVLESEKKRYIQHCCGVADAHRSGQLMKIDVKWLSQVNEYERHNEFQ
tara:strand:+ start:674 stop:1939 length:1266 start_codon:yes stop_codon:yes gene_type:complete